MKQTILPILATIFLIAAPYQDTRAQMTSPSTDLKPAIFSVEPPIEMMTHTERTQYGLLGFPDMPVGIIRSAPGDYLMFGAGFGPRKNLSMPTGTYKFEGQLDRFLPTQAGAGRMAPSLVSGRMQPSPDGSDFDRDYAGGGATFFLSGPRSVLVGVDKNPQPGKATPVLLIYHGEYHYNYPAGAPAYGGLGMAISHDYGNSFKKIGQILAPAISRDAYQDWASSHGNNGGVYADGSIIQADVNGHYVDEMHIPPKDIYYYVIYTERSTMQGLAGFGIARVNKADALKAIYAGKAPQFQKYYAPSGDGASDRNLFTEPGLGGRATPIITSRGYLAQPQVLYDEYLKKFILCDMEQQKQITLRTSDTLFHWSEPVAIFNAENIDRKVFYPSMVGSDTDPTILGKQFFVYFLGATMNGNQNQWVDGVFFREKVTISPND